MKWILGLAIPCFQTSFPTVFAQTERLSGSRVGGIRETRDYSVANNIHPQVEITDEDGATVTGAHKKIAEGKVKFHYVIDMKKLKQGIMSTNSFGP